MYDLYGRLLIPLDFGYHCISLQPYGVNLIYFKQRLFDITELIWYWIAMIQRLENQSLWRNSIFKDY